MEKWYRYLKRGVDVLAVPPIDLGVARIVRMRRRHKAVQTVELKAVVDIHVVILVIASADSVATSTTMGHEWVGDENTISNACYW